MPGPHPVFEQLSVTAQDGVALVADVWNPERAPTLALLPAGGETREVWRPVVAALSEASRARLRIVAIDHRGHGDSGRCERYTFQPFVEDVRTWVSALRGAPLIMGGGSIGGAVSMVAAGEGADIDGVLLLDVPTVPVRAIAQGEVSKLARAQAAAHPRMQRVDPAFLAPGFVEDVFRDADRWRRAAIRLKVPTLLIAGERGVSGGQEPALYREHVPHGQFVAVPAGHLVARDAPIETARAIEAFLLEHYLCADSSAGRPTRCGS